MIKHKVKGIIIKLPFFLRWLKRFIKLDIKVYEMPELKGEHFDSVIIDEVCTEEDD